MNPEEDGITHINVYSKGKTFLGRWLSNFTRCKVETEDGVFQSIEGYWYWLNCDHPDKEKLRSLSGFEAKKIGRSLRANDWNQSEEFKIKIKKALKTKIESAPEKIKQELYNLNVPLVHYYVYGDRVIVPEENGWVNDYLNSFRPK